MRRYLNTLYVTSDGAYVNKDGANVVVTVDGTQRGRVPVHMIGGIVCIGRVSVSPPLMGLCAEAGVTICFLTFSGRFLARVEGPVAGNVLLRRAQYRASDQPADCARIVRSLIIGKTLNQRTVLRRALRDHGGDAADDPAAAAIGSAETALTNVARRLNIPDNENTDTLRGMEGEAARIYFGVFNQLLRTQQQTFSFTSRSRRPPLDPINALLSFIYTLLLNDCRSALESVGLDPAVGFLHRDRPGRPSLALDLMEEFRPVIADRLALSLINRRQLSKTDFHILENGAVLLNENGRKTVLVAFQERKKTELTHSYFEEKAPLGLMPHLQAQLLARLLRGDIDRYPPFVWK